MESVKLCSACGAENPPDEFFCKAEGTNGRCGAPLADQPVVTRETRVPRAEGEAGAGQRPHTMSRAWIVLRTGGRIDVTDGMVLGRAEEVCPDARLLTPHPTISRRHAEIRRGPDGYRIRDLGSTNGTFVNGMRIAAETDHAIAGGYRIGLSPEVEARFEIEAEKLR